MSIFIHGMEMPGPGEFSHVRIYGDGDVTVELSDGTEAVIGHAYAAGFDKYNNPQKGEVGHDRTNKPFHG